MTCKVVAKEEFSAKEGNLLMILPHWSKAYKVEFEINVKSFPTRYVSVLHMTTGVNCGEYGSRIPAIFGNGGGNPHLHVCSGINGNDNTYKDISIPTNKWIKITVSQDKISDGRYLFQCSMDGDVVWSVINNQTSDFDI